MGGAITFYHFELAPHNAGRSQVMSPRNPHPAPTPPPVPLIDWCITPRIKCIGPQASEILVSAGIKDKPGAHLLDLKGLTNDE